MKFWPHIREIETIMRCYEHVVDHEYAELFRVPRDPWNMTYERVDGSLKGRCPFAMSQTALLIELAVMPSTDPRFLWVGLEFYSGRSPDSPLGRVGIRGTPRKFNEDLVLDFEVEADRYSGARKLPRGAERLTSRLRAQLRAKEPLAHYDRRRQMVNTIFLYALKGDASL